MSNSIVIKCRSVYASEPGWQDVFHLHLHVVPRLVDGRLRRPWQAQPRLMAALENTSAVVGDRMTVSNREEALLLKVAETSMPRQSAREIFIRIYVSEELTLVENL